MKIRPLHDRLIVKRLEEEEKTKGGIIIPDTAKYGGTEVKIDGEEHLMMREEDVLAIIEKE
jgi:chaperonin GroES